MQITQAQEGSMQITQAQAFRLLNRLGDGVQDNFFFLNIFREYQNSGRTAFDFRTIAGSKVEIRLNAAAIEATAQMEHLTPDSQALLEIKYIPAQNAHPEEPELLEDEEATHQLN